MRDSCRQQPPETSSSTFCFIKLKITQLRWAFESPSTPQLSASKESHEENGQLANCTVWPLFLGTAVSQFLAIAALTAVADTADPRSLWSAHRHSQPRQHDT